MTNVCYLGLIPAHGVPLKAKREGQIPSLEFELDRFVQDAGFFVTDRVRNTFLAEAGESP